MSRGSALFQSQRLRLQPESYCTAKVHHNFPLSPLKIWIRIHDISYSCRSLLKAETKDEFRCSIKRERLGSFLEFSLEQMTEAVEEEVMRVARVVHPLAFRVDLVIVCLHRKPGEEIACKSNVKSTKAKFLVSIYVDPDHTHAIKEPMDVKFADQDEVLRLASDNKRHIQSKDNNNLVAFLVGFANLAHEAAAYYEKCSIGKDGVRRRVF